MTVPEWQNINCRNRRYRVWICDEVTFFTPLFFLVTLLLLVPLSFCLNPNKYLLWTLLSLTSSILLSISEPHCPLEWTVINTCHCGLYLHLLDPYCNPFRWDVGILAKVLFAEMVKNQYITWKLSTTSGQKKGVSVSRCVVLTQMATSWSMEVPLEWPKSCLM